MFVDGLPDVLASLECDQVLNYQVEILLIWVQRRSTSDFPGGPVTDMVVVQANDTDVVISEN